MTDSHDAPSDGETVDNRAPRYDSVVRWVRYLREQPPEVWGPQQNAVVEGQLESAQLLDRTAEEERQIRAAADDVRDEASADSSQFVSMPRRSRVSSIDIVRPAAISA